jgi:hypothetical protein
MVKHSRDKDQFLKVVIKWMQETQTFEDELKEVSKLNLVLFAQNQELEAKLAKESWEKDGKPPWSFYFDNWLISEQTLDGLLPCFAEYRDQLMALGIIPSDPYLAAKAFANLKADLDEERATRLAAQVEVNVLTRVVKELKISADRFATQISTLEGKVKHLEDKVEDGMKELQT